MALTQFMHMGAGGDIVRVAPAFGPGGSNHPDEITDRWGPTRIKVGEP